MCGRQKQQQTTQAKPVNITNLLDVNAIKSTVTVHIKGLNKAETRLTISPALLTDPPHSQPASSQAMGFAHSPN